MKLRSTVFVVLFMIAAAGAAFAEAPAAKSPDIALGVFLGEPTGISIRWGIAKNQSLEGKAAWSFVDTGHQEASFTFQANYLLEFPGILVVKKEDFPSMSASAPKRISATPTPSAFGSPWGSSTASRTFPSNSASSSASAWSSSRPPRWSAPAGWASAIASSGPLAP